MVRYSESPDTTNNIYGAKRTGKGKGACVSGRLLMAHGLNRRFVFVSRPSRANRVERLSHRI
jgi:hypothetical protein